MKKNFSHPFGSTMKFVVLACAILAVSMLVYLLQKSVFRPMVSADGVPIPFASSAQTSLAGSVSVLGRRTIPGGGGEIVLREVSFDHDEVSEVLQDATPVDRIDFVVTPESVTMSDGALLSQAITSGTKVFGYLYTSRDASVEREMAERLAQGEALSFAQLFPGTFFVSDEQRADGSTIASFEQTRGVTFLPLSAVRLRQNARYVIIANSANTTFTARNLPVCGNEQIEVPEECDDGARNGEICDAVIGGSCSYCSLTCTIEIVDGPSGPVCGNGVIESGEQCDDHNTVSGDGCSSSCQDESEPTHLSCVNNMCVSVSGGGPNGCTSHADCSPPLQPVCGNSIVETGEECDDGNADNTDSCSNMCKLLVAPF